MREYKWKTGRCPLTRTMTNICLVSFNQLNGVLIQLVEIVARVGDLPWLIAKPSNDFDDACKISCLLFFGVGVVEAKVCSSAMMCGITKTHKDSFAVTYVQIPVRFWGEPCINPATGHGQVVITKFGFNLRVSTWFVERAEETFFEYHLPRFGPQRSVRDLCRSVVRCLASSRHVCFLLRLLMGSWDHDTAQNMINVVTFALGFAASFAPKACVKTRSTAFFISSGFAHRRAGMFFTPPITAPRLAHPDTEFD